MQTDLLIPPLPYELRIGVSGHRNLSDVDGVSRAVKSLLEQVQRTFESASEHPHGIGGSLKTWAQRIDYALIRCAKMAWTSLPIADHHTPQDRRTPLHWTIVSALAKGADRIVAKAVLDRPNSRLQAVFPFDLAEYRNDFDRPDDLAEFELLRPRDPSPTVLGSSDDKDNTAEAIQKPPLTDEQRNEGYMAAGRWVVDACEMLIVVWNGKAAAGHGGTGDVVAYALSHGRPVIWINSELPATPPKWLVACKPDGAAAAQSDRPFIERELPASAKELSQSFHQVAAYNHGAAFDGDACGASYRWQENHLRTHAAQAGIGADFLSPIIQHLLPHYAKADQMAIRYQELHTAGGVAIHCLSAAAVSTAVIQLLMFPQSTWLILVEVAAMMVAVVLLRINRNEAWHEKWLHNRHFAERLRTACFTSLLGRSVFAGNPRPEDTLPFYRAHGSWVSRGCDCLIPNCEKVMPAIHELKPLKRFLIDAWLADQAAYHASNALKKRRGVARSRYVGLSFFAGTLIMALVHWSVPHDETSTHANLAFGMAMVVALSIILPAWGGASQAINSLLERERIMGRSQQMDQVLRECTREAEHATTLDDLHLAVAKAHHVMATENQEWMVSLSFRELELPA
ncbi:MAG TPA: hypothetical protein VGN12_05060 [Pirellulales bacterium]|jgi:hypothetical protein